MTKLHLSIFTVGAVFLAALCVFFGMDRVANVIQVVSAVPWFWTAWRLEQLHRKHHRKEGDQK